MFSQIFCLGLSLFQWCHFPETDVARFCLDKKIDDLSFLNYFTNSSLIPLLTLIRSRFLMPPGVNMWLEEPSIEKGVKIQPILHLCNHFKLQIKADTIKDY